MRIFGVYFLAPGLIGLGILGCSPSNAAGLAPGAPTDAQAFGSNTGKCSASDRPAEPDLWAWDSGSRAALASVRKQGLAVVHYETHGCNVQLELLSDCVAKGEYQYVQHWESKKKYVENVAALYASLPIGAAGLEGELESNRWIRTDYMLTGVAQTPIGSHFKIDDLVGNCARATHIVTRIYVGGFGMAAGDSRKLQASASLFSAKLGGHTEAGVEQIERAGDASACDESHQSGEENQACDVPLRIGLLSLDQARGCDAPDECQSRCGPQDPASCSALGMMYFNGQGVEKDEKRAATLFKQACDAGDEDGCADLGASYLNGYGVRQDPNRAWQLLNEPCNKGIAWACGALGIMYDEGNVVQQDKYRASELYGQACDGGDPESCVRRVPILEAECKSGQAQDCMDLAKMYIDGHGVTKDYTTALQLMDQACSHGSDIACTEVGTFYVRGLGGEQDVEKGIAIYRESCAKGRAAACSAAGYVYYLGQDAPQDFVLAAAAFEKGCRLGQAASCDLLGQIYLDGSGVDQNSQTAANLFAAACNNGVADGCMRLGTLFKNGNGVSMDQNRAMNLYHQACDGGVEEACNWLKNVAGER